MSSRLIRASILFLVCLSWGCVNLKSFHQAAVSFEAHSKTTEIALEQTLEKGADIEKKSLILNAIKNDQPPRNPMGVQLELFTEERRNNLVKGMTQISEIASLLVNLSSDGPAGDLAKSIGGVHDELLQFNKIHANTFNKDQIGGIAGILSELGKEYTRRKQKRALERLTPMAISIIDTYCNLLKNEYLDLFPTQTDIYYRNLIRTLRNRSGDTAADQVRQLHNALETLQLQEAQAAHRESWTALETILTELPQHLKELQQHAQNLKKPINLQSIQEMGKQIRALQKHVEKL